MGDPDPPAGTPPKPEATAAATPPAGMPAAGDPTQPIPPARPAEPPSWPRPGSRPVPTRPGAGSRPEWAGGSPPSVAGPPGPPRWERPGPGPAAPVVPPTPDAAPAPAPPPRRRTAAAAVLVAVALLAGFVGGVAGRRAGGGAAPTPTATATGGALATPPAGSAPQASAGAANLAELYRQVAPSVVQIFVRGRTAGSDGSGSGIVIDTAGTVLTNYHVVSSGDIEVLMSDGTTFSATIAGSDPARDLAVVRIDNPPTNLVPARLGDSSNLRVGDAVAAIGSPFGLQNTLTAGIVSGVERFFRGSGDQPPLRGLIQTDAAINPGNSGGPLVNMAGEVVGINTAIESPVQGSVGVGFAIPINEARRQLPALIQGVRVEHPFLGIQGRETPDGIEVSGIVPGTSVAGSDLRAGDVITAVAGVKVTKVDQLADELDKHRVGDQVDLAVKRGTRELTLRVTLRAFPVR